jgi:heptosyltransferase-3
MTRQGSVLRGRYLVQNPIWNTWLRVNDSVLAAFRRGGAPVPVPTGVRRVLIAVGGHLGDAVIATSIFAPVREAFPGSEIGVLTGSWNRQVFDGHPDVRWIHTVDHWKLNRSRTSFVKRWWRAHRMRRAARRDISSLGYDVAIDLYAYYPNSSRLLARAGIPRRVGFVSGGGGPLFTSPIEWEPGRHVALDHVALLRALTPTLPALAPLRYSMPRAEPRAARKADEILRAASVRLDNYAVIHAVAGAARKDWSVEHWRAVARALQAEDTDVVLTGAGADQRRTTVQIAHGITGIANLCDLLTWDEFRHVITQARIVLSVDTVAAHLAAAAGTPCIAIMTGVDDPHRWRPLGERVSMFSDGAAGSPRSPCQPIYGCTDTSCVQDVALASVLSAARNHLAATAASRRA